MSRRNLLGILNVRSAGMATHLFVLLFLVVQNLPSVATTSESDNISPETSMFKTNGDGLGLKRDRTRFARAAVLPLGHRYIGLGKRLDTDEEEDDEQDAIPSDPDKRASSSYSVKDGGAMRFIGLGKRGGGGHRGGGVGDSGLRFIGLGKRNPSAMRFIGLGRKRIPSSGDEWENLESEEIDEENQNYYPNQEKYTGK